MPIVYKVTDAKEKSIFAQGVKVQYGIGKVTKPIKGTGGLFAFRRLKDAKEFFTGGGGTIFRAEASKTRKAPPEIPSDDVGLDNVEQLRAWRRWWNDHETQHSPPWRRLMETPEGSIICKDIKLIKAIKRGCEYGCRW